MISWALCWLMTKVEMEGPFGGMLMMTMVADILIVGMLCWAYRGG